LRWVAAAIALSFTGCGGLDQDQSVNNLGYTGSRTTANQCRITENVAGEGAIRLRLNPSDTSSKSDLWPGLVVVLTGDQRGQYSEVFFHPDATPQPNHWRSYFASRLQNDQTLKGWIYTPMLKHTSSCPSFYANGGFSGVATNRAYSSQNLQAFKNYALSSGESFVTCQGANAYFIYRVTAIAEKGGLKVKSTGSLAPFIEIFENNGNTSFTWETGRNNGVYDMEDSGFRRGMLDSQVIFQSRKELDNRRRIKQLYFDLGWLGRERKATISHDYDTDKVHGAKNLPLPCTLQYSAP
jgi:hypothetical protein